MGVSGFILKNRDKYLVENMMDNIKFVINKLNLNMTTYLFKNEDGSFRYAEIGICDNTCLELDEEDIGDEDIDQGESFNFYVESIEKEGIDEKKFDWLSKGSKLYDVAFVEKIRNYNKRIVFEFIYEYLKLNPKDYFWAEDDWVYTLEDMERLSQLPFDENWCSKNPNVRDTV